ncbi:hypothetical protein [Actinophytocola algeriensis]|uniref:Uncharacterized protein n=1 Tax=Actinophytocola algeriensis TaxID=1768010 RepID=A0A7W7QBJ9_9PSEU|nr:hypothetical protein [Actinophytocola algeriensis]MBB4910569.1 hypothetical protein [Actinophytocola algeriensis]MBE1480442.1 hypothetical protein [Actinophytocola algeriensis]
MARPELLAELDDTILVEFSHFTLQEVPMLRVADSGQSTEGRRSAPGPGGVVFRSRASDHYPSVRIELWTARPEPAGGTWDTTEEATTNLAGEVRLKSIAASMSDNAISLPQSGEYGVIVYVRDDPRVDELEEGSFAETAERWLVQLWPRESSSTANR